MKIAVASLDENTISPHFGRSRMLIVFEVQSGKIVSRELRNHHSALLTLAEHGAAPDRPHPHVCTVEGLNDCEVVLCAGMGTKAAEQLAQAGVRPFVVDVRCTPEEAVAAFLAGALPSSEQGFCRCHER